MVNDDLVSLLPKDSWAHDWMRCWPLAESPRSFILLSGLAMLGAVMGRRVWFEHDPHKVYPLLNLLLIAPSGVGKSTALRDMALEYLVSPLPDNIAPQVITGKSTKEALHEDLMANPHSIILASELSNFFSKEKYQEGMVPYMTDLLDLAPTSVRTKGGGPAKVIQEPAIAVLGGSTKEWLQEQLPSTAATGGFLPRFFIIKEDFKAQRIADPKRAMTPRKQLILEQDRAICYSAFKNLSQTYDGPIDFGDHEASDTYSYWYQTYTPDNGVLAPFAARAGVHVLRLAMLIAVSCGRDFIVSQDVKASTALFDYSMSKLTEIIVPMTAQGKLINKVLEAIGGDEVSDVQVRRAMRNYCSSQDVDRIIGSLLGSKDVKITEDGKLRRVYH